jgi:hypothetical protein
VCDAEFKHPDGSTTRYHKAFPTKGEAEGAEAYYRATGNVMPHLGAPTHALERLTMVSNACGAGQRGHVVELLFQMHE